MGFLGLGAREGWDRKEQAAPLPEMIYLALKEWLYFENTLGFLYRTKEREWSGKMSKVECFIGLPS